MLVRYVLHYVVKNTPPKPQNLLVRLSLFYFDTMTTLTETAYINIQHARVENKIAGIMMFNNIFSSGGRASAKVMDWIYQFVPVELVIQMVRTENDEKSMVIQSAALNFLVYSCESPSVAHSLLTFVRELCNVFVRTKRAEFKAQLGTFLKLLALVNGNKGKDEIVDALLEAANNKKGTDSLHILHLLTEVASTPNTTQDPLENLHGTTKAASSDPLDRNMRILTTAHSEVLRSLVVQGLHGAAPQTTRDGTFLCVKQLLTWIPDSSEANETSSHVLYDISPLWTWSAQDRASVTFPMFLCSILRSELQLLCDELLFLATNSAETVAERFNLTISAKGTVPANMGSTTAKTDDVQASAEAPTGIAGNKDSGNVEGAKANTPTTDSAPVDSAAALQRKIDADIHYFQSRVTRTHAMYLTCLQLVDCVLNLLIGEKETVTDSCWSTLPGESLLSIKKVLYSMLNDLFEFLIDCAEQLKDMENREKSAETSGVSGSFTAASSLRSVACLTLDTMSRFLEQDNELMEVFVKCLPKLLTISHVQKDGVIGTGEATVCVLQALLGYSVGDSNSMEDNKQRWMVLLAYDPFAIVSTSDANTKTSVINDAHSSYPTTSSNSRAYNAFHCELLLHLVDPVRTLIYLGNSNDLYPNTYDALVDCVPVLLPPLVGLVKFLVGRLYSRGKEDSAIDSNISDVDSGNISTSGAHDQRSAVSAALSLMWLFQDLLTIQHSKRLQELTLLMRGEGPSVVVSMLGLEASVVIEFAQTLRTLAAQLTDKLFVGVKGASERECSETEALVDVGVQVAETINALFSAQVPYEKGSCCEVL